MTEACPSPEQAKAVCPWQEWAKKLAFLILTKPKIWEKELNFGR